MDNKYRRPAGFFAQAGGGRLRIREKNRLLDTEFAITRRTARQCVFFAYKEPNNALPCGSTG